MKPAAIPINFRPVSEKVGVFVWVSPSGIKSLVDQRGDADAGEERADHATNATNAAACPRRGERARDRTDARRGAQHDPGQSRAGRTAGLAWPLPAELTDAFSNNGCSPAPASSAALRRRAEPDWASLARELKRPGVNLMVLWDEYRAVHPDGYGYCASAICSASSSGACRRSCVSTTRPATRYLSTTPARRSPSPIRAPASCVTPRSSSAVLGASNHTYAEATWTQTLPDWIERACAHVPLLRRRAASGRARQSQVRRAQGLVLRSRDQSQLRHDGGPLWRRRPPCAAEEAKG